MAVTATTTVPPGARSTSPLSAQTRPGTGPPSSGGTTTIPATSGSAPPPPPTKCCDNGRPIVDPNTNQTICSCHYERDQYQKLILAGQAMQFYGTPYPPEVSAYFQGLEQTPFYSNPVSNKITF